MKFKDYLSSLVSKRKSTTLPSKSNPKPVHTKNHQELTASADCHYDICGYEDINGIVTDDQHSRTQILLARHAELVNTIVGTRSSYDNTLSSCSQCCTSHQPSPAIPPPLPPPLPPKLSLEQQASLLNRNYSSTLATCSPRRECPHHHHHHHHQEQQPHHPTHLISSQYSTPNPSIISSSNSSLWTTTMSLSKKQRSKIRTNPWIGNTSINNRSSIFIEPSNVFHHCTSPLVPSLAPPLAQPEYGIYDPTFGTSSAGLIHSESFPQTTSNGNINLTNSPSPPPPALAPAPAPTSSVILHQSDSGHGFSLSSSRVIDSSSSSSSSSSASSSSSSPPPSNSSSANNTSGKGILLNDKQHYRQKKLKKLSITSSPLVIQRSPLHNTNTEQYFSPQAITSDSGSLTRRTQAPQISSTFTSHHRYQRPSNTTKITSVKMPIDRMSHEHHSCSSSSRSIDDRFSLEFEEILENERSYKQRKDKQPSTKLVSPTAISPRKNPFILPLDETNIKLPSPPPILFSPTLTKTNSRAILKHIEEIENEIRLIKNLDLNNGDDDDDDDEYVLSPHAYPEEVINLEDGNNDDAAEEEIKDERQSINEQVDQWVEKCLKTTNNTNNPVTLLHTEYDHLSNTTNDYIVCLSSNDDRQTSSMPTSSTPQKTTKLMTAFYLSSIPDQTTKRTSSFIDEPLKLEKSQTVIRQLQPIHECPF
ncbi:unnamed protein product [Rotaria sp. Silwood2]|nr:unnamed protein product [Rotaria sp. Silwood2]CAF2502573.1 unnamed protein product [Rotaria sp. Silwood2]CAF4244976.1 unnamed protein product [Rotaria sp. Silwood2]CAF4250851.1 unnamed protein product [Rotaria sp. Silwood2]